MTINQRLILYRRAKKVFENRIKGITYHQFKINQYKTLTYSIQSSGICYTISTLMGDIIHENTFFGGYNLNNIPEIYEVGLKEKFKMNDKYGNWFPYDSESYEGLTERFIFLKKVIKHTEKCIKKQQVI